MCIKKVFGVALALLIAGPVVAELQDVGVSARERVQVRIGGENDPGPSGPAYTVEARMYQVLTNITGDGLTSQTLSGMDGWLQIVHQRLDNVALVMRGPTLTWDGKDEPDHARIIGLSAPRITTPAGEQAVLRMGADTPTQYMRPAEGGQYVLETLHPMAPEEEIGTTLAVTPHATLKDPGVLDMDFAFTYTWIKGREKIDGVNLDVGQPILGHVRADGEVQTRLGEWSCYQSPVGSDGAIYVFIRVTESRSTSTPAAAPAAGAATPLTSTESKDEKSFGVKNMEFGGSMRIRGEYRTGGPKKGK